MASPQRDHDAAASDAALARLIQVGSQRAFRQLYERYHRRMYAFAIKFAKSDVLAEEAVQEVFLTLWERRADIDPSRSLKSFLFAVCKNHLLNVLNRAGREEALKEEVLVPRSPRASQSDGATLYKDYMEVARHAIDSLPPRRREVFRMCREQGRSYREVAQALSISSGTVSDHMVKAHRHLKEFLSRHTDLTFDGLGVVLALLSMTDSGILFG